MNGIVNRVQVPHTPSIIYLLSNDRTNLNILSYDYFFLFKCVFDEKTLQKGKEEILLRYVIYHHTNI